MGAGPSATSNKGNVDLSSLGYSDEMYNTGSGNAGGSETVDDKAAARDLFGWGCTGSQDARNGAHIFQTNYQPYSTSTSTVHITYNKYGYGPDYHDNMYGLSVEHGSDWGCVTGLPSAGEGKSWRTLSWAEWEYLFKTRTVNGGTCEGKSYRRATINSDASDGSKVYGMLLYPDGYTAQTGAKSYTKAEWSAMESDGVVFLPAAGRRNETGLDDVGSNGYYWSSSCSGSGSAYYVDFYSSGVFPHSTTDRYRGVSVRLVR